MWWELQSFLLVLTDHREWSSCLSDAHIHWDVLCYVISACPAFPVVRFCSLILCVCSLSLQTYQRIEEKIPRLFYVKFQYLNNVVKPLLKFWVAYLLLVSDKIWATLLQVYEYTIISPNVLWVDWRLILIAKRTFFFNWRTTVLNWDGR